MSYPQIPAPGFYEGETYTTDELLYSMNGFTQKDVTLAPGQGVLELGTILAQGADKLYYAYGSADATGEPAEGILRNTVDTGGDGATKRWMANLVIMGIVKNHLVKGADAGALTDLGAVVSVKRNTFKL